MPEGSEIHLFAALINNNPADKPFFKVSHSAWNKHSPISVPWSEFAITAVARGKELQLTFTPALAVPGSTPLVYTFNHGLVGKWSWVSASTLASAPSGTQIMFHTASRSLIYNDTMKMGAWKATADWGKGRSPDPILEFYDFCNQTISLLFKKAPSQPICDTLNDQAYFNGIGNYLRAEMLYRAGLDPFQLTMDVFKNTPRNINFSTFAGILKETSSGAPVDLTVKHDPGLMLFYLARQIPLEVITGDMNKYGTDDQQTRFKAWLRVYDKGQPVVQGSRKVHCTPQQRMGKQPRELGKLFDLYPLEVRGFYRNPTIGFNGTRNPISGSGVPNTAGTSAPSAQASPSFAPSSPSTSGGFNQIKRVEENILPCDQIVDLAIPMTAKLLLATTSLSRNGKLNFLEEDSVRSVILLGHPVAFSAWQVYEANADVEDLAETLKRVAISPSAERMRQRAAALAGPAPHSMVSNFTFPGAPTTGFGATTLPGAFHAPSGFAAPHAAHAAELLSVARGSQVGYRGIVLTHNGEDTVDLGPRKSKKAKSPSSGSRLSRISSSSSSSATSDNDEDMSDEDLDSSPPSKKSKPKLTKKAIATKKMPFVKMDAKKSAFKPAYPAASSSAPTTKFGTVIKKASSASASSSAASFSQMITEKSWAGLEKILSTPQLLSLHTFLQEAYAKYNPPVYPGLNEIFTAFNLCPLDKVKVVILGQDPYHGAGQAHGLCFSVLRPTPPPPSLLNIFKELQTDISGFKVPDHGDLSAWAAQGVFLLNTVLTVFEKMPNSHANKGWETFTDAVISMIAKERKGVVFMLWGKPAQKKSSLIIKYGNGTHHLLNASHPSPLSAFNGWFGCKHFSKANTLLAAQGDVLIDWKLS